MNPLNVRFIRNTDFIPRSDVEQRNELKPGWPISQESIQQDQPSTRMHIRSVENYSLKHKVTLI
ncbi:hypothetical protein C2U69_11715 [Cupriavidus pinatubonensis]|nr:hypothetical protein C2U69_11715 [Cupriavidus pinatubonensis]